MLFGGSDGTVRQRALELDVPRREWRLQFPDLHRICHVGSDG